MFLHTERMYISPLLSRQLMCIHFPQSGSVHCIHSCTNRPSIKSSSYSPKQVAHSLLEISASWSPPLLLLVCLLLFSLFANFSSAFRCLSASLASAFFLLISSLSSAFFCLSACFLSRSTAFFFFSSSYCILFSSLSLFLCSLASACSFFFLSFSSIKAIAVALVKTRGPFDSFLVFCFADCSLG